MFEELKKNVKLWNGDCWEGLKQLSDNSIDSIVTDPPYALNFMGKKWDTGAIVNDPEFWKECLRVLKPGGHMAVFGATRTYHRVACAIEDAGFEIRDSLMWVYGCLDDQTMAVTSNGVMPYHKIKKGDLVLSYDPAYMLYEWQPVEEVLVYDVDDTAYRISTDLGDQIVSRNHRCIVERGGEEVFEFAEEAARQREIRVPVLEDLRALLDAVPDPHEGASSAKQDVFEGLRECCDRREGCRVGKADGDAQREVGGELRGLRDGVLAQHETSEARQEAGVQLRVQRSSSRGGVEGARTYRAGELDTGVGGGSCGEDDGRDESGVEGRGYVQESEGELRVGSIRALSGRFSPDVAQGRVCDGASPECGNGDWSSSDASGVRTPYRPRSAEQRSDESDAVRDEQGPQVVRAWRGHKTVVGRITPERYRGVIWCVRVKSGAFVAVRNGFAFPTGNSGFPKSHDVSKAIDKAAGAEREVTSVIDKGEMNGGAWQGEHGWKQIHERKDEPATPQAAEWQGWGTALKPAFEPIVLARKPLSEKTVAANVLRWGTGALNIDGCRVPTDDVAEIGKPSWGGPMKRLSAAPGQEGKLVPRTQPHNAGRWPANVVHDGSDEVINMFPNTKSGTGAVKKTSAKNYQGNAFGKESRPVGIPNIEYGDSGSAARFFYSSKATKKDRANSKHPTVKPVSLMEWLCVLITPPNGIILDPFSGSGTTGQGAIQNNFQIIMMEKENEYCDDIRRRMVNEDINILDLIQEVNEET